MKQKIIINPEHQAEAKSYGSGVSTKQCVEVCRNLRYKNTTKAKKVLEEVIALKRNLPYERSTDDLGHKPGMSAGRSPQKAAKEILRLIKSVEANAQFKGLNTANLKITKLLAHKGSIPRTGGRHRTAGKRTNIEIQVQEAKEKKSNKNKEQKQQLKKTEEKPKGELKK